MRSKRTAAPDVLPSHRTADLKSSWQYAKTRRAAAAAVLVDFEAEHIVSGGPAGIEVCGSSIYVIDPSGDGDLC